MPTIGLRIGQHLTASERALLHTRGFADWRRHGARGGSAPAGYIYTCNSSLSADPRHPPIPLVRVRVPFAIGPFYRLYVSARRSWPRHLFHSQSLRCHQDHLDVVLTTTCFAQRSQCRRATVEHQFLQISSPAIKAKHLGTSNNPIKGPARMLWNNDILCRLGEGHHVLDICDVIAFAPPTSLPCFSALSLPPPSGKWGQRFHDVHIELPPRGPIQRPQHIPDDPPNARLHPARPQTELGQAFSSSAGQISVVAVPLLAPLA